MFCSVSTRVSDDIFFVCERSCLFFYFYICKLFLWYTCRTVCQIYQKYTSLYEYYTDKNNKKLVQMSFAVYIVYTFHLSLHHANLRQNRFLAKFQFYFFSKDLYIYIFAFGLFNYKQVNVSSIQHYLAQM